MKTSCLLKETKKCTNKNYIPIFMHIFVNSCISVHYIKKRKEREALLKRFILCGLRKGITLRLAIWQVMTRQYAIQKRNL